jgi:hypothetical protein
MMGTPFVEDLVDDMVTQSIATAKGTDIFYDALPDVSATTAIAVKDTGGVPISGAPVPHLTVQCLVRSTSFTTARETAAKIYNRYHDVTGLALTNYTIAAGRAMQLPSSLGEDGHNRHLVSFNLDLETYANTQATGATGFGGSKDPNVPTS